MVYPLYYKFSEGNIPDNIQRCEEISRQSGKRCVFRIVEHTNYQLSGVLTDTGYALWKCGVVCELCLTGSESCLSGEKKGQELLFLPDGNLSDDVAIEDILQFSIMNGIKKILADIPAKEELPEQYKRAGFNRVYLYRCYQKEDTGNGATE